MTDIRTLLEKDGMYGIIGLTSLPSGGALITSQDTRMEQPAAQLAFDVPTARRAFDEYVALSRERGWAVIYYGRPHYG